MGIHAKSRARGRTIALGALAAGATLTGLGLTAAALDTAGGTAIGAAPGDGIGQNYFADGGDPSGLGSPVTVADVVPANLTPAARLAPDPSTGGKSIGKTAGSGGAPTVAGTSGQGTGDRPSDGTTASGAGADGSNGATGAAPAPDPRSAPRPGGSSGSTGTAPSPVTPGGPIRTSPGGSGSGSGTKGSGGAGGTGAGGSSGITSPLTDVLSAVADLPVIDKLPVVSTVTSALASPGHPADSQPPGTITPQARHASGTADDAAKSSGAAAPQGRHSSGTAAAAAPAAPQSALGTFVNSGGLASALSKLL